MRKPAKWDVAHRCASIVAQLGHHLGSEYMWRPSGRLHESVLSGRPGFEQVHGVSINEDLSVHPQELGIRNAAMTSISSVELPQILAAYDFSQFKRVTDLGGVTELICSGFLSAHPKLRRILADLPQVVAGAAILRSGSASRCEIV